MTPRTDALLRDFGKLLSPTLHYPCERQLTMLARDLETEQAALRNAMQDAIFVIENYADSPADCVYRLQMLLPAMWKALDKAEGR